MKVKPRQCGLTLMEMTVVIAVMAMLAVFGLPAIRALINSFESEGGAKCMISASLASARAIAAKEHHYAGIRFQKAYDPNDPDLLNAPQYMVFIIHDPDPAPNGTDLANGFRAVEGIKPIKLPDSIGVMDLRYRTDSRPWFSGDNPIDEDNDIDEPNEVRDTTTFSVVFSPSGKLVIHDVRVKNRDGRTTDTSDDDIFNTENNVRNGIAMFYQDDNTDLGFGQESSRGKFIIYDRVKFRQVYERGLAYTEYLEDLADSMIHINPYTGTMIKK